MLVNYEQFKVDVPLKNIKIWSFRSVKIQENKTNKGQTVK